MHRWQQRSLWILFFLLFLGLLWPNETLIKGEITGFFDNPLLCLQEFFEALLKSGSLLVVVAFEITSLALCRKVWVWWLLHLPFFIWLPLELGYLHRYSAPSSAHILAIITETNLDEALGYLGGFGVALIPLYLAWIAGVLSLTYVFFKRELAWSHRSRVWVPLIFVPAFALYFYSLGDFEAEPQKNLSGIDNSLTAYQFQFGLNDFLDTYPVGMPLRLFDYFHMMKTLARHSHELRSVRLGLARHENLNDLDETYVMVVGESSRADHWSLMGYSKETNPGLAKVGNLLAFTDAVSAAAATRMAVPVMLSKTGVGDLAQAQFKPSWISAFKENGFKVYWLSTQMPVGTHDTTIGIYAGLADETRYLNAGTYKNISEYDGVLLGALEKVLADKQKKRLVILHTLGSHFPYQRRYPEEFSKFYPAPAKKDLPDMDDSSQKQEIVNAYDNSIVYTDYFLKNVIDAIGATGAVTALWYSSDHGEVLFDSGCETSGHGFFSKYNFHIPVLFWYSDQYKALFPEKLAGLKQNTGRPVYMGDFYETLLDSLGFVQAADMERKSFADSSYKSAGRLVTVDGGRRVDYDEEFSRSACTKT